MSTFCLHLRRLRSCSWLMSHYKKDIDKWDYSVSSIAIRNRPESLVPISAPIITREALFIGLPIAGILVVIVLVGCIIYYTRQLIKRCPVRPTQDVGVGIDFYPSGECPSNSHVVAFTRSIPSPTFDYGKDFAAYVGLKLFHHSELEEATDNFNDSRELGDGGFGTVYYGELHDGRRVAVKRLYEHNVNRLEQFMNEVEILARLRHQHLVTLYGCTPKRCKELLLVYEYIPNGTVADHLHGKHANSGLLTWPIRLNIAVETAEALWYLHKSDIIHRDVKTTNILLDEDFHVKVADFGLSRLFAANVTHVSTAPQGTPGYVDPEYHQYYHLTEKSDVYSFGVMLIELISSLQAVDISRDRKDINLSNMAITKIQNQQVHELVDLSLGYETNTSVRRMITLVAELAFRCLQQVGDMRPSMDKVLEVLKIIQMENFNDNVVEKGISGSNEIQQQPDGSIALPWPDSVITIDKSTSGSTNPSSG